MDVVHKSMYPGDLFECVISSFDGIKHRAYGVHVKVRSANVVVQLLLHSVNLL